jgi:hypothetical protein
MKRSFARVSEKTRQGALKRRALLQERILLRSAAFAFPL